MHGVDIQNFLSKLPFTTTGIPGELHYPNASFMGPGTSLTSRLNSDNTPKDWSKPINQVDAECYTHDIDYRDSQNNQNPLSIKHAADRKLLAALDKIKPGDFNETIMKKLAETLIGLKLKLGLGIGYDGDYTTAEILGLGIKKVKVPTEYAFLISKELHAPVRKHYPRRRIYYHYMDHIWAMDLMEMPKDKKYKYCLVVIDMWTKYLWLIALENKTGTTVKEALKSLIEQSERKPQKIHSDRGREFWNKEVLNYFDKYKVHLYATESENKSSIVERVIRTIRNKVEPILTEKELIGEKASWVETLPLVLKWYNNEHIHRTTKLTPVEASKPDNQAILSKRYFELRSERLPDKKPLTVGQFVRLYKWKSKFSKESSKNWSNEIFRIKKVLDTNPKTYLLEDENKEEIKGAVYREELLPTAFSF